jgi:hypothetical protein
MTSQSGVPWNTFNLKSKLVAIRLLKYFLLYVRDRGRTSAQRVSGRTSFGSTVLLSSQIGSKATKSLSYDLLSHNNIFMLEEIFPPLNHA